MKLIGSAKAPITEAPFHGDYTAEHVGFRKANKPGIRAGDHLFLYAPGGSRRIFALAEAISDPERDPNYDPNQEGSCQWKVPVHYLINLPVVSGILIDDIISGQRDLTQALRQASHIKLLPEESDTAQRKLEAACKPEVVEPETSPIAGPWLYPISSGADRSFVLADGQSIPVTVDSYRTLLGNGRLAEDLHWYISQNWNNIQIGDEVFIYTGDQDLGIIGYATVGAVEQRADGWCILPHFDLGRSRALLENPVPAAVVREWIPFPRKSVINLASFQEPLRARLPWTGRESPGQRALIDDLNAISARNIDSTTKDALISARVGQGRFRKEVLELWGNCCSVTCSKILDAIRASHIKPWRVSTDDERLDPANGLPLTASLDALFDAGWISFDSAGRLILSSALSVTERRIYALEGLKLAKIPAAKTLEYLVYHRANVFRDRLGPN